MNLATGIIDCNCSDATNIDAPIGCEPWPAYVSRWDSLLSSKYALERSILHFPFSTAEIFRHPALKRDRDSATIAGFAADPWHFGCNDLEPVARQLCPDVDDALDWLGSQGLQARMTGSGSAVFALLPPGVTLAEGPADWSVRECGNMEVHPLVGWAPSDDSVVG
ncbi:MAG: hypothetical protein EON54_26380 [Alcaligenaceae bacterium]|nr:MAG: hypothetical protein EON54_26380 [Alcaligenaceae bacterium]